MAGLFAVSWGLLIGAGEMIAQTDWERLFSTVGVPAGLFVFVCYGLAWFAKRVVTFVESFREPLSMAIVKYSAMMEALRLESASRIGSDKEFRDRLHQAADLAQRNAETLERLEKHVGAMICKRGD